MIDHLCSAYNPPDERLNEQQSYFKITFSHGASFHATLLRIDPITGVMNPIVSIGARPATSMD